MRFSSKRYVRFEEIGGMPRDIVSQVACHALLRPQPASRCSRTYMEVTVHHHRHHCVFVTSVCTQYNVRTSTIEGGSTKNEVLGSRKDEVLDSRKNEILGSRKNEVQGS